MAVDEKYGVRGEAVVVLGKYRGAGQGIIYLQETRQGDQSLFKKARWTGNQRENHASFCRPSVFIIEQLQTVTLKVGGRASAGTFTSDEGDKTNLLGSTGRDHKEGSH